MRIELTLLDGRSVFINARRDLTFYKRKDGCSVIMLNEGTLLPVKESTDYIAEKMEELGVKIAWKSEGKNDG